MGRSAYLLPLAFGVNVALMVHDFPAPRLVPQVLVSAKSPGSVPLMVIPVILIVAVPTFVMVDGLGATLSVHRLITEVQAGGRQLHLSTRAAEPHTLRTTLGVIRAAE